MHTMNLDMIGVHIHPKILGPPLDLAPPNYFGLKFLGPHLKIVFFGGGGGALLPCANTNNVPYFWGKLY